MNGAKSGSALTEQLWAQLALLQACRARAAAAEDPRLFSTWLGRVVHLSAAMAATVDAATRAQTGGDASAILATSLCLPPLPALPDEGEGGVPHPLPKQLQQEFAAGSATWSNR